MAVGKDKHNLQSIFPPHQGKCQGSEFTTFMEKAGISRGKHYLFMLIVFDCLYVCLLVYQYDAVTEVNTVLLASLTLMPSGESILLFLYTTNEVIVLKF